MCDVPITMSDGTVISANIFLPSTSGRYPTVLTSPATTRTPPTRPAGLRGLQGIAGDEPGLTEKGFAVMVIDDRGTGASGGKWESWGQRTQDDYKEVLDWIQAQPWSDSGVATTGESYMGITSLLIAEADAARVAEGKPRAVKAVWADIPMADAYRDVTFQGGALDSGFMPLWLGLVTGLSDLPPSSLSSGSASRRVDLMEHLIGNGEFSVGKLIGATLGEEAAYDGPFYRLRSPVVRASQITVPVVIQGGWYDLFQRGEPLLWESLRNSRDRVLIMSPHYHVTQGPALEDPNLKPEWFGHWLLKERNSVQHTPKVNLYSINGDHWEHFTKFPLPKTKYKRLYLSGAASGSSPISLHDGSLKDAAPASEAGNTAPLLPASSPCSRLTAQWTAGAASNPLCDTNNQTYEAHLADLHDGADAGRHEDHGADHGGPLGKTDEHRRDAHLGAQRGRTVRRLQPDNRRLSAGQPARDRSVAVDLRAQTADDPSLASLHQGKPAGCDPQRSDRVQDRDLSDLGDRQGGRQAAADARHGQHVHAR